MLRRRTLAARGALLVAASLLGPGLVSSGPALAAATHPTARPEGSAEVCVPGQPASRYVAPPSGDEIDPSATNSAVAPASSPCYDHFVYQAEEAPATGLFLYLGGKDSPTSSSTLLASTMAADGFDVIDLAYEHPTNGDGVDEICRSLSPESAIDSCYSQLTGEISYGAGVSFGAIPAGGYDSPDADVDAANSILGRAVYLLEYLGWTQYLVTDATSPYGGMMLNTADTIIAGGSAGANFAAFIAHQFQFEGVNTYSGPADDDEPIGTSGACPDPTPPTWESSTVTPSSAYVGFFHADDPHASCILGSMDGLGYEGPAQQVGASFPAGITSHELMTVAAGTCSSPANDHTCPYDDWTTPLTAQEAPEFAPVWRWMAATAIESATTARSADRGTLVHAMA